MFEDQDGWRYQAFATNTGLGQLASLEARHRAQPALRTGIRQAEHTGLGRLPSREYAINQAWLACVTLVADLTAWLRRLALPDNLRSCEPKALRYRLLHTPPGSPEVPASDDCEYRNPGRGRSTSWGPSPE